MNADERTAILRIADILIGWPLALVYAVLARLGWFDRPDPGGEP